MAEKHKFKSDYVVTEITKRGFRGTKQKKELIYKGNYYSIKSETIKIRHLKWTFFILVCMIAAIFLGIGVLNNEGSRKLYVILPYVFMFLPIFYGFIGTFKLLHANLKMTHIEYEHTVERIKKSSLSLIIIAITTMIGQIIFLIRNHVTNVRSLDYAFLSGVLMIGLLALILLQLQSKYEVIEEPGT